MFDDDVMHEETLTAVVVDSRRRGATPAEESALSESLNERVKWPRGVHGPYSLRWAEGAGTRMTEEQLRRMCSRYW